MVESGDVLDATRSDSVRVISANDQKEYEFVNSDRYQPPATAGRRAPASGQEGKAIMGSNQKARAAVSGRPDGLDLFLSNCFKRESGLVISVYFVVIMEDALK